MIKNNKKITILFVIAIIGSIICLVGDLLLGCFYPIKSTGIAVLFPAFTDQWANVSSIRFVWGDICGIVALLMMFCGFYAIYLSMEHLNPKCKTAFLIASFLFVSVGTVYHSIFAITAWMNNKISSYDPTLAKELSNEFFYTFIFVAILAVIGFVTLSAILFYASIKGAFGNSKLFALVNPLLFMGILVALAKILPHNAVINGFFNWGQQSISLLVVFSIYLSKYKYAQIKK